MKHKILSVTIFIFRYFIIYVRSEIRGLLPSISRTITVYLMKEIFPSHLGWIAFLLIQLSAN